MITATVLAITMLVCLSIFQIALALGAPIGQFAWGGQHKVLPRRLRIGSLSSLLIYFGIAVCLLSKSGTYQFVSHGKLLNILAWIIFAYFSLGIFMNAISHSKKERYVMTPVAILLTTCALTIALV